MGLAAALLQLLVLLSIPRARSPATFVSPPPLPVWYISGLQTAAPLVDQAARITALAGTWVVCATPAAAATERVVQNETKDASSFPALLLMIPNLAIGVFSSASSRRRSGRA